MFQKLAAFPFSNKEERNLVDPLYYVTSYSQSLGTAQTVTC
jgi:hypothetical protein